MTGAVRRGRVRVVVVGAGIAGLAAALRVAGGDEAAAGHGAPDGPGAIDLIVCEAGSRAGGVIATQRDGGYLIEAGPDSFLTEKPDAIRLCERLGIADSLIGMREGAGRTYVVHRGRLVPLPDGFRLIAPARLGPWLRSPLFSWRGKLRMGLDYVLPRGRGGTDETVAAFVRRRLGAEAYDRVAQPMIGTIFTADAGELSLAATMPRLVELERRYGSVIRGFMRARTRRAHPGGAQDGAVQDGRGAPRESGPRWGLFATPAGGMQVLADAAAARLPAGAVRVRTPVAGVTRAAGESRYRVVVDGGHVIDADGVIIATPAASAARLLAGLDGRLAALVGAVRYASSASVTLAYRRSDIAHPLHGFGFVVPRVERRPILAASFSSEKFEGRGPADRVLLRVFLGGALAPEVLDRDDEALAAIARGEMASLVGAAGSPQFVRVARHPSAMPQYVVGHLDRVAEIEALAAGHPGLALAGAAYRGVGVPDCIRSGEAAADRVLAHVAGGREVRARL